MGRSVGVAFGWALTGGFLIAACTPSPPPVTADAEQAEASPAAAAPANGAAPVAIADAATWAACGSLPPPPPTARYIATDCRIDAASDTSLLVRFSPTPEEVEAGGRIDIDVVGPDGAVRDTLTEAYVFKYVYPVMDDTDGDGVAEVLVGRDVSEGRVTHSIWRFDAVDGRYRQAGTQTTPQ